MAMPLEVFRAKILQPNLDDLAKNYSDLSKGYNASSAVDAYTAHILYEAKSKGIDPFSELGMKEVKGTGDAAFKAGLAKLCPEFSLVRDIAKANKHALLTAHNPDVNGSGDTGVQVIEYGDGKFGEGRYGGVEQLVVTDQNDTNHLLETLIREAVSFLDGVAAKLKLQI